jgi:hypothetical protein
LAHLREPVAPADLIEVATARIRGDCAWIKLIADVPGSDGNMLAAQPTYPLELVAELCAATHALGGGGKDRRALHRLKRERACRRRCQFD